MDTGAFSFAMYKKLLDIRRILPQKMTLDSLKKVVISNVHLEKALKILMELRFGFQRISRNMRLTKIHTNDYHLQKNISEWNKLLELFYSSERIE